MMSRGGSSEGGALAGRRQLEPKWDEAGFDRSVAINPKGPFFLIQALLPLLANPVTNL